MRAALGRENDPRSNEKQGGTPVSARPAHLPNQLIAIPLRHQRVTSQSFSNLAYILCYKETRAGLQEIFYTPLAQVSPRTGEARTDTAAPSFPTNVDGRYNGKVPVASVVFQASHRNKII